MDEDVQVALRKFLLSSEQISGCVKDRIYCDVAPSQAPLPYIIMTVITTRHEHTLSDLAGMAHTRIQFDCSAVSRKQSTFLAKAIRKSGVCSFKGNMHGLDVRGARLEEGQRHVIDPPIDGSDEYTYTVNFDLVIDHTEEV